MADSIFTKIINGEEPGEVLYEDDRAFVILTLAPNRPGHSLVIPKRQVQTFYEMGAEDYRYLMDLARRFAVMLDNVYRPKVVALSLMGLGVPHVHVHLVPIQDETDMNHEKGVFVGIEKVRPEAERIRAYLAQHPFESIQ